MLIAIANICQSSEAKFDSNAKKQNCVQYMGLLNARVKIERSEIDSNGKAKAASVVSRLQPGVEEHRVVG